MPEAELGLADKIVVLHDAFDSAGIAHAFGGALALAYYAEPRATRDIDVNLFVGASAFDDVASFLSELGVDTPSGGREVVERDGQVRLSWGRTPLDLFFAYDSFHDAMASRRRVVPFGESAIPVLAPEHLAVCKAVFNRAKDWIDIEQMLLVAEDFDTDEARRWLAHLVGERDERFARLDDALTRLLGR